MHQHRIDLTYPIEGAWLVGLEPLAEGRISLHKDGPTYLGMNPSTHGWPYSTRDQQSYPEQTQGQAHSLSNEPTYSLPADKSDYL